MTREALPEWRDRTGALFLPVRRTAKGVEYRRAAPHDMLPSSAVGQRIAVVPPEGNASALADKARALGYGKRSEKGIAAPAPAPKAPPAQPENPGALADKARSLGYGKHP